MRMEQYMMVMLILLIMLNVDTGHKFGQMAQNMRAIGIMTNQMGKGNFIMQMGTYMMVIGKIM